MILPFKLIKDDQYSNIICELCDRDLKCFYHFKKDLSLKQQRLYELLPFQPKELPTQEKLTNQQGEEEFTAVEGLEDVILEHVRKEQIQVTTRISPEARRKPRKQKIEKAIVEIVLVKDEKFHCNDCGIYVANNVSLKRHYERVHLKLRNFHCDHCLFAAFFKHSLEKHIVKHIPDEFRDRFICEHCNFISKSAVNIDLHKKYEHGDVKTLFVCDFEGCLKTFARPGQLTAHVRLTHEKRKEKICSICSRAFSTSEI